MSGSPARGAGWTGAALAAAAGLILSPVGEALAGAAPGEEVDDRSHAAACAAAPHRVELRATGRAPGASGFMDLRFGSGPFGVAVTEDGSYRYRISVRVTSVPPTADGTLVAWAATPELDRHVNLGPVGEDGVVEGEVSWNKFLVFVTSEASAEIDRWQGPILMTGTSPSGNMHTMAGHGIFEQHGVGC